ncbi:hypothetical protein BDEG_23155 [Batrachochytrium dendrobatidis JEL423]|uniref:Uncharacterized protein n=1 Tax=Batrachochytrium dendrobatidis (strain JEL423) TaxID=403673 RepID=A0A177WHY5_BATDL|nr:hypothetical protein BDEG_23155 [Batrachochytrium dendrobatidis JEL423]
MLARKALGLNQLVYHNHITRHFTISFCRFQINRSLSTASTTQMDQQSNHESALLCWGIGNEGQLGLHHVSQQIVPTPVLGMQEKQIKMITGGVFHSAALVDVKGQGQVHVWGSNYFGQAGYFPELQSALFSSDDEEVIWEPRWLQESLQNENVVSLSCGDFHTIVLTETGKVLTWGAGLLGHDNEYFESRPHVIKRFEGVDGLHIKSVNARMGLSFATASSSSQESATKVFIWGHYDSQITNMVESDSTQSVIRVKSTIPVEIDLQDCLDSVSLVEASHHLVVVQGTKNGRTTYLIYGSHPTARVVDLEPTDTPYYAMLENVPLKNDKFAPLKLLQIIQDPLTLDNQLRQMFIMNNQIVVLRESGLVHAIPMFTALDDMKMTLATFTEPITAMTASPLSAIALGKSGKVYQANGVFPRKPKPKSIWSRLIDVRSPAEKLEEEQILSPILLVDALMNNSPSLVGCYPHARLIGMGWKHYFIAT